MDAASVVWHHDEKEDVKRTFGRRKNTFQLKNDWNERMSVNGNTVGRPGVPHAVAMMPESSIFERPKSLK